MATQEENRRALQEIADKGLQDKLKPEIRDRFAKLVELGVITLPGAKTQQAAPQQEAQQRTAANPRAARAQRQKQESDRFDSLLQQIDSGEIAGADLTSVEAREVQKRRIDAIPEITGSFKQLSENLGFMDAMAAMTAFDPAEFGQILTNADPAIGVVMTPEGEHIAVNNETGDTFSINKLGPSTMDAVQLGGAALAFTGAGKLPTLTQQAIGAGLTQAVIETGQALKGGEFNPEVVALTTAGVPVASKLLSSVQPTINGLRKTFNISTPQAPKAKVTPLFGQESKHTERIRQALESGDKAAAGYMLEGSRKVVKDPAARELIRQGSGLKTFDPGKVTFFSGSSKADKKAFSEMVDIVEAGLNNAEKAAKHRPGSVVGDAVMKRYKIAQSVAKQAGKDVKAASKKLRGDDIDTDPALAGFLDDLQEEGVKVIDGELDFAFSTFDDVKGAENLLNNLWAKLKVLNKSRDGLNIHRFKRYIDNQVDIGKRSTDKPIVKDAEIIAGNLRKKVNNSLREVSEEYANANDRYSAAIDPLKEFQRISGQNFDPESPLANEFAGKLARGLLSNNKSREALAKSIYDMEDIARINGAKLDTNIASQLMFVDELEKSFGSFAQTGISSEVGKGVGSAIRGDSTGAVLEAGKIVMNKARRINEDSAIKALKAFVKQK